VNCVKMRREGIRIDKRRDGDRGNEGGGTKSKRRCLEGMVMVQVMAVGWRLELCNVN